jgi:L,D-transpeptidase-like protein
VIASEQLAAALVRLDPRDWEVLDLSLRRRVPDDALAEVLGVEVPEVARRRAAAIERLADDLDVQRGEDLGHVLTALLEPEAWEAAEAQGGGRASVPSEGQAQDAAAPEADAVLELLEGEPKRRRSRKLAAAAGVLALLAAAGAGVALALNNRSDGTAGHRSAGTRPFSPRTGGPLLAPFPTDPKVAFRYLTAYVRTPTTLYSRPGGRRALRIPARTEWGSPRVLGVVRQSDGWLGVQTPEIPNGELAWIPQRIAQLAPVEWSVRADLSRRKLWVRRNGHTVRRFLIAVGAKDHSTPTGRFAVTDRLRVTDQGSPYGCCVLALTGHQIHLPPDWPGGDRLAIHATRDIGSIGKAVSLGCMRVKAANARWLIEHVPLGTPVFIRS